jgi:hypothetical protein
MKRNRTLLSIAAENDLVRKAIFTFFDLLVIFKVWVRSISIVFTEFWLSHLVFEISEATMHRAPLFKKSVSGANGIPRFLMFCTI